MRVWRPSRDPEGSWALSVFGPVPASTLPDLRFLEGYVYHEAGHAFVNPHADANPALAERYAPLYGPIRSSTKRQAYGTWFCALNEHVLRACHARIYLATKGREAAEEQLAGDEQHGFRYVRSLYDKLTEYEADRNRYPDFGSFYPVLLTALEPFLN